MNEHRKARWLWLGPPPPHIPVELKLKATHTQNESDPLDLNIHRSNRPMGGVPILLASQGADSGLCGASDLLGYTPICRLPGGGGGRAGSPIPRRRETFVASTDRQTRRRRRRGQRWRRGPLCPWPPLAPSLTGPRDQHRPSNCGRSGAAPRSIWIPLRSTPWGHHRIRGALSCLNLPQGRGGAKSAQPSQSQARTCRHSFGGLCCPCDRIIRRCGLMRRRMCGFFEQPSDDW